MKAFTALTAMLILAGLSGCAVTAHVPGNSPDSVDCPDGQCVALGQSAKFGGISVIPREVIEDSRCPAEVQCVWAGRVVVSVELVERGAAAGAGNSILQIDNIEAKAIKGGTLRLTAITPPSPAPGKSINPKDYRFFFRLDP